MSQESFDTTLQCSHDWDCLNTYACVTDKCVKRKCLNDADCKEAGEICLNKFSCEKAERSGGCYAVKTYLTEKVNARNV